MDAVDAAEVAVIGVPPFIAHLETAASPSLRHAVESVLPLVVNERERPGAGGYENCLGTSIEFARWLDRLGIVVYQCGYGMDSLTYAEAGGYRLRSGRVLRHHYLALGPDLVLFDPTGGQSSLANDGPMRLSAYEVASGEPFLAWRARERALQSERSIGAAMRVRSSAFTPTAAAPWRPRPSSATEVSADLSARFSRRER